MGAPPPVSSEYSLRLAYADPPYPRRAAYYAGHPQYGGEVDHVELIGRLVSTYDAWALSTAPDALRDVLPLCPAGTRVAVWVRGARPNATAGGPLPSWEPVLFWGGRASRGDGRLDSLVYAAGRRLTDPGRVIGAKPAAFARWVFDLLGALPGDGFDDLFPGSGGIGRAWTEFSRQPAIDGGGHG